MSKNEGIFQEYLSKIHSHFENLSLIAFCVSVMIVILAVLFVWYKIRVQIINHDQKTMNELYVCLLKLRTSAVVTFLLPLLANLKGEAIFSFLIAVAKIVLEYSETIDTEKKEKEALTRKDAETFTENQDETFKIIPNLIDL